ncbi:hypothetical protein CC85DRAFT_288094 [Cutaneotrichosporon oleaginosum]|uniref:Galactose-1-phosphate uridylyltransferase n=1 Tax=Cutaneotrichosporon oleaginosum TaxID=879819 RepID=A0A0J0XFG8_9TREE|nr:uncharacterized protein CC85DRAFT_288094 [Cutaneotrichosporon oleaginosum]KLT39840.1 hypothetical protein CC85DRAFT_288094 [Cutaneotrichosporon oleaginosum]TXT05437.1 hypothetical protein COLE_06757 [Cutaneotrichosporon oleaginosum]
MFDPADDAHRRYNPLNGTHVLVSPHRMKRPWNGQTEETKQETLPRYDPACHLCPGNARVGGEVNPTYTETISFPNDYPAVLPDPLPSTPPPPPKPSSADALFAAQPVRGRCRVVCFHPRHDLTLARMSVPEIEAVVRSWRDIYEEEGRFLTEGGGGTVQIFENRGAMMGASAPHPHGQVWSVSYIPDEVATEISNLEDYSSRTGCCLLCDYARQELERGERVVAQAEGWVAVVPYWALWPFEALVLPTRHVSSISDLSPHEDAGLATILKSLLVAYDNLFSTPFPYSMGLHQSPHPPNPAAHLHLHFYPPLLRSASVRKFVVGFEMLAEAQRDLTPEAAAARLRSLPKRHYSEAAE